MDVAKAIGRGVDQDLTWNHFKTGASLPHSQQVQVGLIPTLPSGGAEAGDTCQIDNREKDDHGSISGAYADFVIFKPSLTYSIPANLTAKASLVTYVQASACYLTSERMTTTDGFIRKVSQDVLEGIEAVQKDLTDGEARGKLMWAAVLSTHGILFTGIDGWHFALYNDVEIVREWIPQIELPNSHPRLLPLLVKAASPPPSQRGSSLTREEHCAQSDLS